MKEFDLTKALSGHPLVMRNGAKVAKFRCRKEGDGLPENIYMFPYCVNINGYTIAYTSNGRYYPILKIHPYDLFLDDNE